MGEHITIRTEDSDNNSIDAIIKQLREAGFTKMSRAQAIRIAMRYFEQYLTQATVDNIVENITRCLDGAPR